MERVLKNSALGKVLSLFLSIAIALAMVVVPLSSVTKASAGTSVAGSTVSGISSTIYIPSSYKEGTAVPLYVAMHGCTQSYTQFATTTNINALADEKGFIVLHLQQSSSNNVSTCFKWYTGQSRTSTEPKAIISIIDSVKSSYTIDDGKVFCFGFSAGAAMAHLLCACYPDVFAGGGIGSGLAFKSATLLNYSSAMSSGTSVDDNTLAGYIVNAMSSYKRVVPMIIFHGTDDAKVNVKNGAACTMSWVLAMNQIGANIDTTPTQTNGSNYTVESYIDANTGKTVVQYYVISGMDHAWSGGSGTSYAYSVGPNATRIMYDFFEEFWRSDSSDTSDTIAPTTTVSPVGGSYTSEITVSFSVDEESTTYYTTDGTNPTTNSNVYDKPFEISSTATVMYFSVDAAGNKESVKTAVYKINIPVVDTTAPITTVSPNAGVYYDPIEVVLSVNENATTYYTTDGTEPNVYSDIYTAPFVLSEDATVKFFSIDTAGNSEAVKTVSYTVITDDVKGTSIELDVADREAKLYLSGKYRDGIDIPLVVMLHGDGQTAEQFELLTNMNELADSKGFAVLYLSADASNPLTSWKWYNKSVQSGSGDTAYIVNAINTVNSMYSIDDSEIYTVGFGAGAAMANIVAATNPELIKAIAIVSGVPYAVATDLNGAFGAKENGTNVSGQAIVDAMGTKGDVTPVIVIHGENDETFSFVNAGLSVSQWAGANDLLDNGSDDDSVKVSPSKSEDFSTYSKYVYSNANGLIVMEMYNINNMGYAWSGGNIAGDYTYPSGPNASELIYDFFLRTSDLDYYVEPKEIDTDAPVTTVNPEEGVYQNSVTVALSVNENATTYYTIDGTAPTTESFVYTSPLTFTETTTLNFFSIDEAGNVESVKTKVYTITKSQSVTTSISYDKSLSGYAGSIAYFGYGTDVVKAGLAGLYNSESLRGIVSFDTSSLNVSNIESAVLRLEVESWGSSVNSLSFDIINGYFGDSGVQISDFSATASKMGIATASPVSSGYIDVEIPSSAYEYLSNRVEFRICSTVTNGFSESVVTFSDATFIITSTNVSTYSLRDSSYTLSDAVDFGDEKLKSTLVAFGYDMNEDGELSLEEMGKIYGVDLSNLGLTSVDGLEHAVNLKYIDICGNNLSDIGALGSCIKLQYVNISNNLIENVDAFEYADDMFVFVADNNNISNVSVISENEGIVKLSVAGNAITDISSIGSIDSLRSVNFSRNNISDIASLEELSYLNYVYFADNKIEKLFAISKLGYMFEADFSENYLNLTVDGENTNIINELVSNGVEVCVDEQKANGTINSVTYVVDGDNVVFTITTSPDYNRVKVTTVDDLSGYIKYTSESTVDAQGNTVYTLTVPAVVGTTKYAFDGRLSSTGIYENDYYYVDVTVEAPAEPEELFKFVSYEIEDGKVTVTLVTAAGDYNRVKISLPSAITKYVKYTDKYTVNADGDYVWTLKFDAPETATEYAFDIRVASVSKYVKDYYYVTIDPTTAVAETVFVSASGEVVDGRLVFTVVTLPTAINRVKVMLTSDQSSYVKLIDKYTVNADGNYVWTASIAAPSEVTSYTCDVRSSETNKYMKDFYTFEVDATEEVEVFKSVSYEIKDGKIIFTVVTAAGDYNRVKVTTPDNLGGSLGVGTYTVNENGDYVWKVKAAAPTESMTYAFDIRSSATGKYLKDYYIVDVTVEAEEVIIKSATHEIKGDKIYFTVVTAAGNYERIKATTADKLGGSLGVGATYTVDENGDYVWVFKVAAPTESTTYAFDLRSSETGKYLKDYFIYDVAI